MCTSTDTCEVIRRERAGTCLTTKLTCVIPKTRTMLPFLRCSGCGCSVPSTHVTGSDDCAALFAERFWKNES